MDPPEYMNLLECHLDYQIQDPVFATLRRCAWGTNNLSPCSCTQMTSASSLTNFDEMLDQIEMDYQ